MSVIIDEKNVFIRKNIDTSTFTYNTGGWYTNKGADEVVLQFQLASLAATSLTIRLEGQSISLSNVVASNYSVASLFCKQYTTKHNIATVERIVTKMPRIRLGAKIDTTATPNYIYAGISFIEKSR